jgi:hypothetical protein
MSLLGFLFLGDLFGTLRDPQVLWLALFVLVVARYQHQQAPLPTIASINYVSINNNRSSA